MMNSVCGREKRGLVLKKDYPKKRDDRQRSKHLALKCYIVAFGDR